MTAALHVLQHVTALASSDGRGDFQLVSAQDGRLVRLNIPTANLWVMRGTEDGSMMDREMDYIRKQFVKLTESEIEQGPSAIYANLRDMADEIISNLEEIK